MSSSSHAPFARSPHTPALYVLVLTIAACRSAHDPADAASTIGIDVASFDDAEELDAGATFDGGTPSEDAALPDSANPLRVLFVGNSYTFANDLPSVVRALGGATPGGAVEVDSVTQAGARLADHWSSTGARDPVESGDFDAVVLQGQSVEPIADPEVFSFYAELFACALRTAGSRGVWFATWARRAGDPIYENTNLDPATMTEGLEYRYRLAAAINDDMVARVGAAWQIALTELPDVALHVDDGSHPTPAGTLLAGCVILQALTGRTPRSPDPPPLEIPFETASALCAIAPRVICTEGKSFCDGRCVDLHQDPLHCGTCDTACDVDDPCRGGTCGCDPGLMGCARVCYDLSRTELHCGACDVSCAQGEVCENASCVCPSASAQAIMIEELSTLRADCDTWNDGGTLECNAAAHAYCAALGCFDSGFGPPSGHAPRPNEVVCVAGDLQTTTYTALEAFVPACDGVGERLGQNCSTAISRYCASTGAVSGFGPVESAGNDVTLTCVPTATVVRTTLDALRGFASRCPADPVTCSTASWNFCASRGHPGGFGPVEVFGNDVDVVCVER